jgi:circadian clock protein KaiC
LAIIERTKFGIQGLDKVLNGGIPQGNIVLLSGGAGTGKSTISLQFLINGAQIFGEKGIYISTEQSESELQKQAEGYSWNLNGLIQKNLIKLVYFDISSGEDFLPKLDLLIKEFKPRRVVIDSMTTLTDSLILGGLKDDGAFSLVQVVESVSPIPRTEQIVAKTILFKLINNLKSYKITTLLTSELYEEAVRLSADGISEFITDGVIILHVLAVGNQFNRTIQVRKMRYSAIDGGIKSYNIGSTGIEFES